MIITGNFSEGRRTCFEAPFAFMEWNKMLVKSQLATADQGFEECFNLFL